VADQTLALYQGLCPSPAVPPSPMALTLQTVPDGPSGEAPRVTTWDEDLVEAGGGVMRDDASIYVQARLRFRAADLASGEPDALAVCRSYLAHSGLNLHCHDHSLSIKGDMETVLAALNCCRTRLQQADVWNNHQPGDDHGSEGFSETVRADPLVLTGR